MKLFGENVELDSTPISYVTSEVNIIKWFGLFPDQGKDVQENPNRLKFFVKRFANAIITFLFLGSIWTNVAVKFDDSAEVIETLYFGLTQTTFVAKLINLSLRFDKYQSLAEYLTGEEFNRYTKQQHALIRFYTRLVRLYAHLYRGCVSLTIVFFIVYPFLDESGSLKIMPSWFPEIIERYQILCFGLQLWPIIINGYVHSTLDCISAAFIVMCTAQFEILKDNLSHVRKGLRMPQSDEEMVMQEDYLLNKLAGYVHHHVTIIRYANEVESMLSVVQFVQFLSSSIIMCVTGFQIIMTPVTDLKFISLILYFSCNMFQVVLACSFGHDLMDKSSGVGEACFMSDWYNSGIRVRRTIFIIMERSKRPVVLTAGKFFDLTLQTLMQVIKTSYSYLTLLNRVNEVDRL